MPIWDFFAQEPEVEKVWQAFVNQTVLPLSTKGQVFCAIRPVHNSLVALISTWCYAGLLKGHDGSGHSR